MDFEKVLIDFSAFFYSKGGDCDGINSQTAKVL